MKIDISRRNKFCDDSLSIQSNKIREQTQKDIMVNYISSFSFKNANERLERIVSESLSDKFDSLSKNDYISLFNVNIGQENRNIDDLLPIMLRYGIDVLGYTTYDNKNYLYEFLMFEPFYESYIDSIRINLLDDEDKGNLYAYDLSKDILDILSMCNISTVKDLEELSLSCVLFLLFYYLDDFISTFSDNLHFPLDEKELFAKPLDLLGLLDKKQLYIVTKRYGLDGNSPKTLEEIAAPMKLTRERIRQIIKKMSIKISHPSRSRNIVYSIFGFYVLKKDKKYMTFEDFRFIFGDNFQNYLCILMLWNENNVSSLVVDQQYKIVYDAQLFNLDDILEIIFDELPSYIEERNLMSYNETQNAVIRRYYHLVSGIYIRRNQHKHDIIADAVEKYFPDGYHIGNSTDYDFLVDQLVNELHLNKTSIPTSHAIVALLNDSDRFIQSGKGTYKNINQCPELSNDLVNEIICYINSRKYKSIYYSEIFNHFKDELEPLGVVNAFYFKGLIDKRLPSNIKTKRNYLINKDANVSEYTNALDNIIEIMRKYDSVFSFYQLRNLFPGLTDSMLYGAVYAEKKNGLLFLDDRKFIYFNKFSIPQADINQLKNEIDICFDVLGYDVLSSSMIYSRLSVMNKDLIKSIRSESNNIIQDGFSFYSLAEYLFSKDFRFGRPFIGRLSFHVKLKGSNIIAHYIRDNDIITNKLISQVARNIGMNLSVTGFDEVYALLSRSHVAINQDSAIKKTNFHITQKSLDEIAETINEYINLNKSHTLNTKSLTDFDSFPRISYPWNTHLLIGIVRSYLIDYYTVLKIKGSTYINADFTIRRRQNGTRY